MKSTSIKREIAIIGISGKFPKSSNIEDFWKNLMEEKELSHFYSDNELIELGVNKKELSDSNFIKVDSFIEDAGAFDFSFFGYTPDEAAMMNPQSRLFHQHAWMAIEDAGYNLDTYKKKIGVFAGANNDLNWSLYAGTTPANNVNAFYLSKISNPNYMSSLVAYNLNLRGPCYFVDTACSTSLTASHLASRSLLMKECSLALAGGVKLFSTKGNGYYHNEGSIESNDGHVRSFDIDSSGIIGGEGVGVVVMKRLDEAIKDRDNIYAVIKASAVNNDGSRKSGYTMPSINGQVECIKMAHRIAGVESNTISYIEAHGTGTKLGDPIEIEALNIAFDNNTDHKCAVGSVKTNMGHLDEAAGIAGLIKTALALKYKELPASLNYVTPNPEINFAGGPFYVNASSRKWENQDDIPLRAGINSFGVGGSNTHIILEEAPKVEQSKSIEKSHYLMIYSATNLKAVERYESKFLEFLSSRREIDFSNFMYTLQTGRKQFDHRGFIVVKDRNDAIEALKNKTSKKNKISVKNSVVFMFSGQGSQYYNMAKQLYEENSYFKSQIDYGFMYLKEISGSDYKEIVFGDVGKDIINDTQNTQPILFLFEFALAKLLLKYGVKPDCMIGHSLGEYVAACISGVFSLEDGLKLITSRGNLMGSAKRGSMLSIGVSYDVVEKDIFSNVSIAAINSPSSFVVSGTFEQIDEVQEELERKDIPFVKLKTSHAFHSNMMNDIIKEYESELESINFSKPLIPFISNLSGDFISDEDATSSQYWLNHLLKTVNFQKGITRLINMDNSIFIEVGPGKTLTSFYTQCKATKNTNNKNCNTVRHIKDETHDNEFWLKNLGQLWSYGLDIDWEVFNELEHNHKVSVPTYPFEKVIFPTKVDPYELLKNNGLNLYNEKRGLSEWFYLPSWKQSFLPKDIGGNTEKENYLFFSDGSHFSELLLEELIKHGKNVTTIFNGSNYEKNKNSTYVINSDSSSDYLRLAKDLQESSTVVYDSILYSWGLLKSKPKKGLNFYETDSDFNNLLEIIKAFKIEDSEIDMKIVSITDKDFNVLGDNEVNEESAAAYSLLHVFSQENQNIHCCVIDIESEDVSESLIMDVRNELEFNYRNTKVAYRNGKRWVPHYENINVEFTNSNVTIKEGGNYLITGGIGHAGSVFAEYLLVNFNVNLLLIGRENLPSRDRWNAIIDSNDQTQKTTISKLKRLQALEKLQGKTTYKACDVSNSKDLIKTVSDWEKEFGEMNGIIHAAGVTSMSNFNSVERMDRQSIENQYKPKVDGIINLYDIFKERNLDFVTVTSSLATILGGLSYTSYAASNGYMDAFILSRKKELKNWTVINFDGISDEEIDFIDNEELIEIFERSLSLNVPQLIVSIKDVEQVFLKFIERDKHQDIASTISMERPVLEIDYLEASTPTQEKLVILWQEFFGIKKIGIQDDFFELGGDSLKVMTINKRILKLFGVEISLQEYYIHSTIESLGREIEIMLSVKDIQVPEELASKKNEIII